VITDDWYFEPDRLRLREDMLRAHLARKAAAVCEISDDGLSRQQVALMDDAHNALTVYMEHRTTFQTRRATR
jgi:hypothetical protein